MSAATFIETYRVDHSVCDRIVAFFRDNEHLAQPGRLGEVPRVDKSMKDSLDLRFCLDLHLFH